MSNKKNKVDHKYCDETKTITHKITKDDRTVDGFVTMTCGKCKQSFTVETMPLRDIGIK